MEYPAYMQSRPAVGSAPYEVIVEQPGYWAATGDTAPRGELVWTPLAPLSNAWHCWRTWRNSNYSFDGVDCRALYGSHVFRCYTGRDFGLDLSDYTFPGNAWGPGNYSNYATLYSNSQPLQLAIPAGTKRLYALILRLSNTAYCTFSLSPGGGSLDYTRFNIGTGNPGGSDIPALGTEFEAWVRIATDCGGQVLTLTSDGVNNTHLLGFVAVSDTPSNPYDGVFDPGSRIRVTPTSQCAPHPMRWKTASTEADWWGLGHTTGLNTLAPGYAQTLHYEADGTAAAWSPAARASVKVACSQFRVGLEGVMTVGVNSSAEQVADYRQSYRWTAAGMDIYHRYVFNANAAALGLQWAGDINGGYCAQWGLEPIFDACRSIPPVGRLAIAPYDDRSLGLSSSGTMLAENPQLVAMFTGQAEARLAAGTWLPQGYLRVVPRSLDGLAKFYQYWKSDAADVGLNAGDTFTAMSRRTLALRSVL